MKCVRPLEWFSRKRVLRWAAVPLIHSAHTDLMCCCCATEHLSFTRLTCQEPLLDLGSWTI